MKATEQTIQQLDRALRKTAEKFPSTEEASQMTDLHIRVTQETGELMVFDDDDRELMRCVIEQWIENRDDTFYDDVAAALSDAIQREKDLLEGLSILKPYSFVLENDESEHIQELYVVDDDLAIVPLSGDSLEGDLDDFLDNLLKE